MRAGYTDELRQRLERHPQAARPILEVLTVEAEDIIDTQADWDNADSTAGITTLADGGAKLTGTGTDFVTQTTVLAGADITSLPAFPGSSITAAVVEWGGAGQENWEIHSFTARLDPNTGAGQEVTTWVGQMWRVIQIDAPGQRGSTWRLDAATRPVQVTAGSATADITFDFGGSLKPTIGPPPEVTNDARLVSANELPMSVFVVAALKGEGTAAANASWLCDSGNTAIIDGNHTIRRRALNVEDSQYAEANGTLMLDGGSSAGVPTLTVSAFSYSQTTITFTTDDIDIGQAPGATTTLEVVADGQQPGGSSLLYELNDGGGWTTVVAGDVIGEDRTGAEPSGSDLSGMTRQQNYDMRVTLTPSTDGLVTPIARRMGVRELDAETVDGLVTMGETTWAVDPIWLQSEVPEIEVEILRNGVRDYRSFAEELLSDYYIGQLILRIWIGHPDLARAYWLHIDDFVVDDYETAGPTIKLYCVSPLAYAMRDIPSLDTTDNTREPLQYSSSTLKATYDDLLANQIGVSSTLVGPGVTDTATTVTKTIKTKRKGRDELNRVAFLAGGSVIPSQGRYKFASFFDDASPVVSFPIEEVSVQGYTPGLRARITGMSVPYSHDPDKDAGRGAYAGESYYSHTAGVSNLGRALIDLTEELDDEIAQWIPDATLADTIGERMVKYFGTGMILLRFRTNIPHPWLELGDVVAVESDRFVARNPNDGNAIRGYYSAIGRIQAQHDIEGREFTVWVQSYADLLPGGIDVTRQNYAKPGTDVSGEDTIYDIRVYYDEPTEGQVTIAWTRGSKVEHVLYYTKTLTQPIDAASKPWPAPGDAPNGALAVGTDELVVDVPDAGDITFVQLEPRDADGVLGDLVRVEIHPKAISDGSEIPDGSIIADALVKGAQTFTYSGTFSASGAAAVAWTSGTLKYQDGATYSITGSSVGGIGSASNPTFIYFDATVSTTLFQNTTSWETVIGDTATLVAVTWSGGVEANIVQGINVLSLDGQAIAPLSITTDRIAANAVTAAKISVVSLDAISAAIGTLTSGKIQNSGGTNYVDWDATGSSHFLHIADALIVEADGTIRIEQIVGSGEMRLDWNDIDIWSSTNRLGRLYVSGSDFILNGGVNNLRLTSAASQDINLAPGSGGNVGIEVATEDIEIVDAGSTSATEQDWIEVTVGGNTGYIRVYASK